MGEETDNVSCFIIIIVVVDVREFKLGVPSLVQLPPSLMGLCGSSGQGPDEAWPPSTKWRPKWAV
jgi:hypothetical protein